MMNSYIFFLTKKFITILSTVNRRSLSLSSYKILLTHKVELLISAFKLIGADHKELSKILLRNLKHASTQDIHGRGQFKVNITRITPNIIKAEKFIFSNEKYGFNFHSESPTVDIDSTLEENKNALFEMLAQIGAEKIPHSLQSTLNNFRELISKKPTSEDFAKSYLSVISNLVKQNELDEFLTITNTPIEDIKTAISTQVELYKQYSSDEEIAEITKAKKDVFMAETKQDLSISLKQMDKKFKAIQLNIHHTHRDSKLYPIGILNEKYAMIDRLKSDVVTLQDLDFDTEEHENTLNSAIYCIMRSGATDRFKYIWSGPIATAEKFIADNSVSAAFAPSR